MIYKYIYRKIKINYKVSLFFCQCGENMDTYGVFVNQKIYAIFEVDTLKSHEFSNALHILYKNNLLMKRKLKTGKCC